MMPLGKLLLILNRLLEKGHFQQKCLPAFGYQKMGLPAAETKNGVQKPRKTPPKMVDKTFVSCVQIFWASNKRILKNRIFLTFFEAFSTCTDQKLPKLRGATIL